MPTIVSYNMKNLLTDESYFIYFQSNHEIIHYTLNLYTNKFFLTSINEMEKTVNMFDIFQMHVYASRQQMYVKILTVQRLILVEHPTFSFINHCNEDIDKDRMNMMHLVKKYLRKTQLKMQNSLIQNACCLISIMDPINRKLNNAAGLCRSK